MADTCNRCLVATTTVWSGASYIYTKDAVKILGRDEQKPETPKEEQSQK